MKPQLVSLLTLTAFIGYTVCQEGIDTVCKGITNEQCNGICDGTCVAAKCDSYCALGSFEVKTNEMSCIAIGSCAYSSFYVNRDMKSITFGHENAAYDATFSLESGKVDTIDCGPGFCNNVNFRIAILIYFVRLGLSKRDMVRNVTLSRMF